MKTLIATFDQPLYAEAIDFCSHYPSQFKHSVMRLGEFHLIISYIGCFGYVIAGSGIEELWQIVYAKGSIPQMLSGLYYSRALAAHLTTYAALTILNLRQNIIDNTNLNYAILLILILYFRLYQKCLCQKRLSTLKHWKYLSK